MKAHPAAEGVVGGGCRDEDARATAGKHSPSFGQGSQGVADGVTVDAEAGGKRGLGREFVTGAVVASGDLARESFGDGSPDRGLCYQNFTCILQAPRL